MPKILSFSSFSTLTQLSQTVTRLKVSSHKSQP